MPGPRAEAAEAPSFKAISRGRGKRERTRASLIDATAWLIATKGAEDISISDISAAADVASGTFYNHFRTKGEIIAETAFRITEQLGAQIHEANEQIQDPLVRMALGARKFVSFSLDHPTWAWALLRSVEYLPSVRSQIYRYMAESVHFGTVGKAFRAVEDEFTYEILINMLFGAVRAGLTGLAGAEAAPRIAEMHLRVLGVPPAKAAKVAYADFNGPELSLIVDPCALT